jgi:iron complex outermembrane receptor protein
MFDKKKLVLAQFYAGLGAMALGMLAPGAFAQTASSSAGDEANRSDGLEDIVVTAQKREENLQSVPISITALGAASIEANRIQNVGDIGTIAPNTMVRSQPGGNSIPLFTIRGVTAGNSSAGTNTGVALYIDGVYLGRTVGALFDVADIERIEVLKGPQGTLFGRNATGGAVSLTTRNPTGTFGVEQEISTGNYDLFRAKTRIDLPEWNGLSASLTYLHLERDGDIRNLGGGTIWDFASATGGRFGKYQAAEKLGGTNTDALQASLRYDGGPFDLVYKFDYTDSFQTAPGSGVLAAQTPLAQLVLNSQPGGSIVQVGKKRPDAVNNWFTSPNHVVAYGHLLTASYRLNDSLSFKNILAYRNQKTSGINQIDGAGGLTVQPSFNFLCGGAACNGQPFLLLAINSLSRQHQISNEAQITYSSDALDIVSGAYFFRDVTEDGGIGIGQTLAVKAVPNFVLPDPARGLSEYRSRSIALFAQATGHLTNRLDLTGGIRQTWDRKAANEVTQVQDFLTKSSRATWLVNLSYRVADSTLVYAKASTGFVSGGILNGLPYKPETVTTYETGLKADFLDRRARTNIALFYSRYRNLQFPFFGTGVVQQLNAGRARTWGGEFEGTFIPVDGLTLGVNVGYTNFKYLELAPSVGNISTYLPNYRPKVTSSLSAEYSFPEFSWGGKLTARLDGQYNSSYNTIPAPATAAVRDLTHSPATWLFNGRVSLANIPVGSSTIKVAAWGKNLTDRKQLTFATNLGLVVAGLYQPARTYGVDLSFDF